MKVFNGVVLFSFCQPIVLEYRIAICFIKKVIEDLFYSRKTVKLIL